MRLASLVSLAACASSALAGNLYPKRGLVFVPNARFTQDNSIWLRGTGAAALAWYYNYGPNPSDAFAGANQSTFEFVPMLWGAPTNLDDTSFLERVKLMIKNGRNVTHALSFNEPDAPWEYGGSNMRPDVAARVWANNFLPLRELGVKVSLPGLMAGGNTDPNTWMAPFLANCSIYASSKGQGPKNCTADFVPVHVYGSFDDLAGKIARFNAAFKLPVWVTEYAYNDQALSTTQSYFRTSLDYLERIDSVERYSYFGSFRSTVSNVGPNAAMLDANGNLTDIGSWYLAGGMTGNIPTAAGAARTGGRAGGEVWGVRGLVVGLATWVLALGL